MPPEEATNEELTLTVVPTAEIWEENKWKCHKCGSEFFEDEGEMCRVDAYLWCGECAENHAQLCQSCEQFTAEVLVVTVEGGDEDLWCQDCIDSDAYACGSCGSLSADTVTVDNAEWCRDCFDNRTVFCNSCEEYVDRDNVHSVGYDSMICHSCFEGGDYFMCAGCDQIYDMDDLRGRDRFDEPMCPDCYEDCDHGPIRRYDYEPTLFFHFDNTVELRHQKGLLFLGVETEVEVDPLHDGNIEAANLFLASDSNDFFYCMEDSSIEHGFEAATHPFTWEWAKKHRDWWAPLFQLREHCTSFGTATCGMHVHLSRSGFMSKTHLLKFSNMFFDNRDFVLRISRRHVGELNEWASPIHQEDGVSLVEKAKGSRCGGGEALAFDHDATIECRIFRGTLSPRGYWANLEFLKALYDFTAQASIQDVTPEKFIGWAKGRAREYPLFLDMLCSRLPSVSQ